MKFRDVIRILPDNDFQLDRQEGSHRQYEGVVGGIRRLVTISGKDGEEVGRNLLGFIKRQSGLPKKTVSLGRCVRGQSEWTMAAIPLDHSQNTIYLEFGAHIPGRATIDKLLLLVRRQFGDPIKIHVDGLRQALSNLGKGFSLDGNIKIHADGKPPISAPIRHATQRNFGHSHVHRSYGGNMRLLSYFDTYMALTASFVQGKSASADFGPKSHIRALNP